MNADPQYPGVNQPPSVSSDPTPGAHLPTIPPGPFGENLCVDGELIPHQVLDNAQKRLLRSIARIEPPPQPAATEPPATGATPETDKLWLAEYPHDQERDERLEKVLTFARSLETRLHTAEAEVRRLTTERDAFQQESSAMRKEVGVLNNALGILDICQIEPLVTDLRAQLQAALAAQQKADGEFLERNASFEEALLGASRLGKTIDDLRATITRLTEERDELTARLDSHRTVRRTLEEVADSLRANLAVLEASSRADRAKLEEVDKALEEAGITGSDGMCDPCLVERIRCLARSRASSWRCFREAKAKLDATEGCAGGLDRLTSALKIAKAKYQDGFENVPYCELAYAVEEFLTAYRTALQSATERAEGAERDRDDLRRQRDALLAYKREEFWIWQGDGTDHLESLTCRILIQAPELRSLFARLALADGLAEAVEKAVHLLENLSDDQFLCHKERRSCESMAGTLSEKHTAYRAASVPPAATGHTGTPGEGAKH